MGEPIRIAQVLNRMDSGGIEAVVMNYYRYIDHSKVQFDFYFNADSRFPQREELEGSGAEVCFLPDYSRAIGYQRVLRKAFREKNYQIVHAHMSTMSVFPLFAAWRAGVPVRICHNHSTANWGEGKKTLLKYILRPFNKILANRWFACGERAGRWMYGNRAFDEGRVTILPNAIDSQKFAFDLAARQALRQELSIPQDALVVGNVGRFTYAKNHPFLIAVFRRLLEGEPNAFLLLVGEGEMEESVRRLVRSDGLEDRVIFTGVRQDVNKLYSAMDVFCLPSHYEGFALVAAEAQAAGLPVVCSLQTSGEIDLSERVIHLSIQSADIPAWVEQIQKVRPDEGRITPSFAEQLDIVNAGRQYQDWLEKNYEEAVSKP